jgi:hypothetical protein
VLTFCCAVLCRGVLCLGVCAGEHVEYRRMAGGGTLQLLKGRITADGNIQCFCERCKGQAKIPNSIFEEHAGSKVLQGVVPGCMRRLWEADVGSCGCSSSNPGLCARALFCSAACDCISSHGAAVA